MRPSSFGDKTGLDELGGFMTDDNWHSPDDTLTAYRLLTFNATLRAESVLFASS